jgi:hypothetical protein
MSRLYLVQVSGQEFVDEELSVWNTVVAGDHKWTAEIILDR